MRRYTDFRPLTSTLVLARSYRAERRIGLSRIGLIGSIERKSSSYAIIVEIDRLWAGIYYYNFRRDTADPWLEVGLQAGSIDHLEPR